METYQQDNYRIICNENEADFFHMDEPHTHDEYELYYLLTGTRLFMIKDRVYPMVAGTLAFLNGEEPHRVFSKSSLPCSRFMLCIKKGNLKQQFVPLMEPFIQGSCIALSAKEQVQIELIIRQVIEECNSGDMPMKQQYLELLVHQLLIYTFRKYHSSIETQYGGPDILKVLLYIHDNYKSKISLAELCSHLNISISHLTRLFKSSTGYTVVEYINNMRIKRASELLIHSSLPVSEIALEAGFSSPSYLAKLFRQYYDISPLQYRKQNQT